MNEKYNNMYEKNKIINKKTRNYLVSINYENKCDLIHNVTAHTKSEAEMLVISILLLRDPKYSCRPLTSYKLKSCLEDYKGKINHE